MTPLLPSIPSFIQKLEPVYFENLVNELKPDFDKMVEKDLQKWCKIKTVCDRRYEDYRLIYYKPQEYQKGFHESNVKIRAVFGGNKSGKTTVGVVEGLQIALGIHPTKKIRTPNSGRIVATDFQKGIGEDIQEQLDIWLPKYEVRADGIKKSPAGYITKIFFKNGSKIDFMSYEQEVKLFEGGSKHWYLFNEPPPRDIFIASQRGLISTNGICWICATPLDQPWMYDEIFLKADKKNIEVFNFDIRDNKYLTEEAIKEFEDKLTDDEKEARLHGKFMHLSGLIYKQFNTQIYCKLSFEIPKHWTRYFVMDYHSRERVACSWIAVDPKERKYVYDELFINGTIKDIAEAIKSKEKDNRIHRRHIDPISATPDRITNSSPLREFARLGINCRPEKRAFSLGKNAVDEALKLDKEGQPGLIFFKDCVPETIRSFQHYQWDEYASSEREAKEKPRKKYAHFPDCIRYILVNKPTYVDEKMLKLYQEKTNYEAHQYTGYGH